jgi:hypothetical protein
MIRRTTQHALPDHEGDVTITGISSRNYEGDVPIMGISSRNLSDLSISGISSRNLDQQARDLVGELALATVEEDGDSELEQTYDVRVAPSCPLCPGQAHLYRVCPKFLKLSVKERRAHLMDQKKCFRCFREGHNLINCQSKLTCKHCKDKHNTLVCLKNVPEAQHLQQADDLINRGSPASLPIVAVLLENPTTHKTVQTNALLDTGSQRTFIAEHLRIQLALTGHAEPYHSVGFGGVKTSYDYSVSSVVKIFTLDRLVNALIKVSSLPDPVGDLYPKKTPTSLLKHPDFKTLKMAPVFAHVKVDMIIGTDNPVALRSSQPDVLMPGGPLARHSMFGYVLMGQKPLEDVRQNTLNQSKEYTALSNLDPLYVRSYRVTDSKLMPNLERANKVYDRSLMDLLERMYAIDNVDNELAMSVEDKFAYNNLKKSRSWTGSRFEASCLWERNESCLSNNRNSANKRLDNSLRNPKFNSVSAPATIDDYLERGYRVIQASQKHDDPDHCSFLLGRVAEVHPNPTDGITRSVSVAIGQNIWRHLANSLLLLVCPEHNTTDETIIS